MEVIFMLLKKILILSFSFFFALNLYSSEDSNSIDTSSDALIEADSVEPDTSIETETRASMPQTKPPKYNFSYSFLKYDFTGDNIAKTDIYGFEDISMDFHLLSGTWFYSNQWTFVALTSYGKTYTQTQYPVPGQNPVETIDRTEGLGDLKLLGTSPIYADGKHLFMYTVGVSLPTGTIDEKFDSNKSQRAAYNMQMGSGTVDALAGLTYTYSLNKLNLGTNWLGTVRTGRNKHDYKLGDEVTAQLWSKYQVNSWLNAGIQFNYKDRGPVDGYDESYEIAKATAPENYWYYHSNQINWDGQAVVKFTSPPFWGSTLASLEGGVPFWQGMKNRDDLLINTNFWLNTSVSTTF